MNDKEMFDVLKPFMPMWCQKVLPAVFDQSLSYYELLCKVLQKYNELVAVVNAHSEKLENHETRIVTLETVTKEIQQKLTELDEAVKQNTANIAVLTERVNQHDEDIASLQAWIDSYKTFLGSHRAIIDPTTHDIMLSVHPTLVIVPWSKWQEVIYNGGDSFTILESNNAVGILSLTVKKTTAPFTFSAFGAMIENGDLHYFTATYTRQGATANKGGTDNWKEVELLDITNIKQSLGNGEYDTVSQKVLTQLINSKLNHDMGITGASAGQYLNIATVDSDGKPLTYGFGSPGGGGSGVDIVQTTGQSTTSVMSQKATTDAINTSAGSGVSVVYPTTAGGTDGKFVDGSGSTLTRATLLSSLIGSDGKNRVFTVKKTGSSEWQRITWFKSAAGEGLYDFAWYETDGTSAKAGVDRLTMATTGLFAVSEVSSKELGGGSGVDVVQTTGNSTTSVMSQDAVTKSLRAVGDYSRVQIGTATMKSFKVVSLLNVRLDDTIFAGVTTKAQFESVIRQFAQPYLRVSVSESPGRGASFDVPLQFSDCSDFNGSGDTYAAASPTLYGIVWSRYIGNDSANTQEMQIYALWAESDSDIANKKLQTKVMYSG